MAAPNYRNYGGYGRSASVSYGGAAAPRTPEVGREAGDVRRRFEREKKRREAQERRQAAKRRRSFVLLVLIPLSLLLGSVYLHNVASDTQARITTLQERIDDADARYEQLGVREAELSNPERIRTLAAEDHGMKDASASQIEQLEADE